MTRRLLVVAVVCCLALAGCLGGFDAAESDSGLPETTTAEPAEPTAESATTTATAQTTTAEPATATTEVRTTTTESTESAPRHRTYRTYEALAANASFPVPEPNVSAPFEFQSGVVVKLETSEYVAMAYHHTENGTLENVVSIRKAENESVYDLQAGNATTVGDHEARYVESDDGGRKLVWECDGYVYRVSVQKYTDEFGETELRSVAESVGCE